MPRILGFLLAFVRGRFSIYGMLFISFMLKKIYPFKNTGWLMPHLPAKRPLNSERPLRNP